MHAGDALPKVSQKGCEMVLAMGFDYSIIFNVSEKRLKKLSLAFHRKIPSVDIECGRLGIPTKTEIDRIVNGMFSLFMNLKMINSNKQSDLTKTKPIIIDK
ncbi:hypothetical protein [Aquimarina sp. AU119]|uniref:hypothetical protein n=1 Tax=Aquimarina sp. AU119 TaxID=2108528 RepID=UPI000D69C32C|nr:hypothetical protein [Aquimarina sp. AU119]